MKLHYLAVIFIIIMMPIFIVFSEYVNNQITIYNTELTYDDRLLNSTYDSIKEFQMNTVNSIYYTPEIRVQNINAAVNAFFKSLVASFGYEGNKKEVMQEYVPAVLFTLYDGYYVYSPYRNVVLDIDVKDNNGIIDKDYEHNKVLNGIKPYVYYSCRYKRNNKFDVVITYSMDNYISVEGEVYNSSTGKWDYWEAKDHSGYLINGTEGLNATDGVVEHLKECLPNENSSKEYLYIEENGTKYYWDDSDENNVASNGDSIFYLDQNGERAPINVDGESNWKYGNTIFEQYYDKIINNNTGNKYYVEAKEFTDEFLSIFGDLSTNDIVESKNYAGYQFEKIDSIFEHNDNIYIQDLNSNFNRHRKDVIRAVITTNLATSISGFSNYSSSDQEFIMPKISETDWEMLENNICVAAFLQGFKIGGKTYNSYKVIPNNLNKEYVSENDLYILKSDNLYTRINDSCFTDGTGEMKNANDLGCQPVFKKIDFEIRNDVKYNKYYNPLCYKDTNGYSPYLSSYTGIGTTNNINSITTIDMYRYIRENNQISNEVKKAFYTALGRERYGSYKFIE